MALPKSTGLYELGLVLAMTREKGQTPQQWLQRLDQGRTVVGEKLGGNNLSDGCYVELLLRGLQNREKGELIKAEVIRQAGDPYQLHARVLVDCEGELYRATITRRYTNTLGVYVDVEYDQVDGFTDNTEASVPASRLTPDNNTNTHAKAMESVRASAWAHMCERIRNDIGPQPSFNPKQRRDKRKLYTYHQAMRLSQPVERRKRKRQNTTPGGGEDGSNKEGGQPKGKGKNGQNPNKKKHLYDVYRHSYS